MDFYGKYVHPLYRIITPDGVSLVAETIQRELSSFNFDLKKLGKMSVLECGGTGRDALAWISLGAKEVTHIDFSRSNIERLKKYCLYHHITNLNIICADILKYNFPAAETFDIIRSRGVIHHLKWPALGLSKYCFWLKKGGILHFNVYRAGTFYYYGVQQFRCCVVDQDLEIAYDIISLDKENNPRQLALFIDDCFVQTIHPTLPSIINHDILVLGLKLLNKNNDHVEIDHNILYPDLPQKTEHLSYWALKLFNFESIEIKVKELLYHQGINDIILALNLPEAIVSLRAFQKFIHKIHKKSNKSRIRTLIRMYIQFNQIATKNLISKERHQQLADCVNENMDI